MSSRMTLTVCSSIGTAKITSAELEAGSTAVPNRLAGSSDRRGFRYNVESSRKDLETTEWPESGGLSTDQTSARSHAAHGSSLPPPLRSPLRVPLEDGRGTALGR